MLDGLRVAFEARGLSSKLRAATTTRPCSAASATKNTAAGKLTPGCVPAKSEGTDRARSGLGGGKLVLTGCSLGAGGTLAAPALGMEGVIGAGSESAMLSATSTVAITFVTAG